MRELNIIPFVTGNIEKIPVYISNDVSVPYEVNVIENKEFYIGDENNKKYFKNILKTPEGTYVSLEELAQITGGNFNDEPALQSAVFSDGNETHKINARRNKKNQILDRNTKAEYYNLSAGVSRSKKDTVYEKAADMLEYSGKTAVNVNNIIKTELESQKPVMIRYMAEKQGFKVRKNILKKCIEIYKVKKITEKDYRETVIKEIHNYYMVNGKAIVSANLFRMNFDNWHEPNRTHYITDTYKSEEDAIIAAGSIFYNLDVNNIVWFDIEPKEGKYVITKTNSNSKYFIIGRKIHKNTGKVYEKIYDFDEIGQAALSAYTKEPEDKSENVYVTAEQLRNIGWREDCTGESMIEDLNRVLREYGINNIKSIQHLIAQCSYESNSSKGKGFGDGLVEDGDEKYFSKYDYPPYIGAGYIHLTGEDNYNKFKEYLRKKGIYDEMITISSIKGKDDKEYLSSKYVAANYAWESVGFFWTKYYRKINERIEENPGIDVDEVSHFVVGGKGDNGSFGKRRAIYESVCNYIVKEE